MQNFCTYFDHNYLPRGIIMLESLYKHCRQAHVHILCLSNTCYSALSSFNYPFVSLIRMDDFEADTPELVAIRSTRSTIEYYFTITPCLPWYLLHNRPDINTITYIDADLEFLGSPEAIFSEARDASVIITPHRFSKNIVDAEKYGLYNVSWLTFNKTRESEACLKWYKQACLTWCYDFIEGDKFADQKYLNMFPVYFRGVHIIRNQGCGVAPWNLNDSHVFIRNNNVFVNDDKLIFYHAHNVKKIFGPLYSSGLSSYKASNKNALKFIVKPYVRTYALSVEKCKLLFGIKKYTWTRKSISSVKIFIQKCKLLTKEILCRSCVIVFTRLTIVRIIRSLPIPSKAHIK